MALGNGVLPMARSLRLCGTGGVKSRARPANGSAFSHGELPCVTFGCDVGNRGVEANIKFFGQMPGKAPDIPETQQNRSCPSRFKVPSGRVNPVAQSRTNLLSCQSWTRLSKAGSRTVKCCPPWSNTASSIRHVASRPPTPPSLFQNDNAITARVELARGQQTAESCTNHNDVRLGEGSHSEDPNKSMAYSKNLQL